MGNSVLVLYKSVLIEQNIHFFFRFFRKIEMLRGINLTGLDTNNCNYIVVYVWDNESWIKKLITSKFLDFVGYQVK